jgi:hypothetical protein
MPTRKSGIMPKSNAARYNCTAEPTKVENVEFGVSPQRGAANVNAKAAISEPHTNAAKLAPKVVGQLECLSIGPNA